MKKPQFPQNAPRRVKRSLFGFLFSRLTISAILILVQFAFVLYALVALQGNVKHAYDVLRVVSMLVIIWLVRKPDDPSYKIAWIIIIMALAPIGSLFYLLWGNTPFNRARLIRIRPIDVARLEAALPSATQAVCEAAPQHRRTCQYLYRIAKMPAWDGTAADYFPLGEAFFASLLADLSRAERFIFLEYFIIDRGEMWDAVLEVLCRKAAEGVDVRVMYDDVGCISTLPRRYDRRLEKMGIRAVRFNRFLPTLNTYFNYRDHRKICVIDGNIGYTGGINLADEYINRRERFGHWKDTAVRLTGSGTANLTALFLQLWDFATGQPTEDLTDYLPTVRAPGDGCVQAFADSPLDNDNVSETVFLNIISSASKSVYITSPYLTLDSGMISALCAAAQSGVDVRIITPGIPDKRLVYLMTRSYYAQLVAAGVRIFEYTPGFLHAKMLTADENIAVVGTINMDFRSFYLHFECGTVFYGGSIVSEVCADIGNIMAQSREIDLHWLASYSWIKSVGASILSLFAPLL